MKGAHSGEQTAAQRRFVPRRQVTHHPRLDLAHLGVARRKESATLGRQPRLEDPAVVWMGATADQTTPFERQQHLVHRLRGDQSAAGKLGVGEPAAALEHAQRRVLVDRQPVRPHDIVDVPPNHSVDPSDEVEQRRRTVVEVDALSAASWNEWAVIELPGRFDQRYQAI